MNTGLVSVIIPTYNSERYLKEAVNSVLAQTYNPIEIIIIDDGSTDNTRLLFESFKQKGIVCISQKNQGAASARNKGIEISKGEYIQFLDSDDIIHPEKIERQVELMQSENADLSFTFLVNFTDTIDSKLQFKFIDIDFSKNFNGKDILRLYGKKGLFVLVHAWLLKRTLINAAGFWNSHLNNNDDAEFFSRVMFWSKKVVIVKEVLAYYRKTSEVTLSSINSLSRAYSAYYSWKLIHSLMLSSGDRSLLSYPKKGFNHFYHLTKKKFPKISKLFAYEFDKISEDFYLSNSKYNYLIKLLGLENGTKILDLMKDIKQKMKN